jgi:hypothetical protein
MQTWLVVSQSPSDRSLSQMWVLLVVAFYNILCKRNNNNMLPIFFYIVHKIQKAYKVIPRLGHLSW